MNIAPPIYIPDKQHAIVINQRKHQFNLLVDEIVGSSQHFGKAQHLHGSLGGFSGSSISTIGGGGGGGINTNLHIFPSSPSAVLKEYFQGSLCSGVLFTTVGVEIGTSYST